MTNMTDTPAFERVSGWHRVSIGHLVMGLAFVGMVVVWALVQSDTVTGDDIHWLLPLPWVVAGAVGLGVTAVTGQRRYAVRQTGWVGTEPNAPVPSEPAEAAEPADAPEPDEIAELTEPVRPAHDLPKYPETKQLPEEKA